MNGTRKNLIKPYRVLLLLCLLPIIVPAYLVGVLSALIWISVYCGNKKTEDYFMEALGHETTEQILNRLMKERAR